MWMSQRTFIISICGHIKNKRSFTFHCNCTRPAALSKQKKTNFVCKIYVLVKCLTFKTPLTSNFTHSQAFMCPFYVHHIRIYACIVRTHVQRVYYAFFIWIFFPSILSNDNKTHWDLPSEFHWNHYTIVLLNVVHFPYGQFCFLIKYHRNKLNYT